MYRFLLPSFFITCKSQYTKKIRGVISTFHVVRSCIYQNEKCKRGEEGITKIMIFFITGNKEVRWLQRKEIRKHFFIYVLYEFT
jgi:hypothetical protein